MSTPQHSQTPGRDAWASRELKRETAQYMKVIGAVVLAIVLIKSFVIESCPVHGPSMLPLLHENERILVWKLPTALSNLPGMAWLQPIGTNDLAVFRSADEEDKHYIKRVIAVGPPRTSERIVNAAAPDAHSTEAVDVKYQFGKVYVNNALVTEDYLVEEEKESPMESEAWLESGEYYVLGDHRSVSKDSRRFGPVKHDQLIGRAVFRFWPLDKFGFL